MRRGPGQRAGLTRERVLAAARALAAERGLAGLSMRTLAAALGVRPNALYSHVASKDALVDALLDGVLAEVEVPDAGAPDPLAGVHAMLTSTYRVLLAHADLVPAFLARQGARGPNAQHLGVVLRALLGRAGVQGDAAQEALNVLVVHAIGSAAFASGAPLGGDGGAAHFDRGLRWLLTGIAAGH